VSRPPHEPLPPEVAASVANAADPPSPVPAGRGTTEPYPYDVPDDLRQLGEAFLLGLPDRGLAWAQAVDAEIDARRPSSVPGAARGCLKATIAALGKQLPERPSDDALGPRLVIDLPRAQAGFARYVEARLAARRRGLALADRMLTLALGGALADHGIAATAPVTAPDAVAARAYLAGAPGLREVPHAPAPPTGSRRGLAARLAELLDDLGVALYRDYRDEVRPDTLALPVLAGLLAGAGEAFASLEGAGGAGA
jgi:hypothetical protein